MTWPPFTPLPASHIEMLRSRDGLRRIQQIIKDLRDFARTDESDLKDADLNHGIVGSDPKMR
jgi:phosphoglycerate-specific signal transduction histidine kinase